MEINHTSSENLVVDRRINLVKDAFRKSYLQCEKEDNKILFTKTAIIEEILEKPTFNEIYKRDKYPMNQYWFLKHEKFFHNRMKKFPLIPPVIKKRVKSAKKKNKYRTFSKLDAIKAKHLKRKPQLKKYQRSIFNAIRKYGKATDNSKSSASTLCTITKINA
mmetsp:Transcript_1404/g.1542  ORF Transcript_1404/g.1542 Transcript_1404/m.1542 type:complete len:162 (+) Transcript_1404:236-721(+)